MKSQTSVSTFAGPAWSALIAVLVLAPAVVVVFNGRDVNALDFAGVIDSGSSAAWAGRLATGALLLLAATVIALTPRRKPDSARARRRLTVLALALTCFALGHVLLPAIFGAEPEFDGQYFFGLVILAAAFTARSLPSRYFYPAMKTSLLVLLAAGLAAAAFWPDIALQTSGLVSRLPIVESRYWGLGSSPNNIAPLALLLLLLTIHTPYRLASLNLLAGTLCLVTILLAQSQTTWAATLAVAPSFALYCKTPKPFRKARLNPALVIGALVGLAIGLMMLIWQASQIDLASLWDPSLRLESGAWVSTDQEASDSFTGRTEIWAAAIDTWREHPWFGYGLQAWGLEHRTGLGLPFAFNAHNQLMHSISAGGSVAGATLVLYLTAMLYLGAKYRRATLGLGLALTSVIIVRGFSESPLDTGTLLSGELAWHLAAIYVLAAATSRSSRTSKPATRPKSPKRHTNRRNTLFYKAQ